MERNIESKSGEPITDDLDDWLKQWRASDEGIHCSSTEYSEDCLCGVSDDEVKTLIQTEGFIRGSMLPASHEPDALPTFEDDEQFTEFARTCGKMHTHIQNAFRIFCDRHRKYGPENIAGGGLAFLEARRNDKLARIRHSGKDFSDESRDDAYYDLANYWLIELMFVKGEWPMPVTNERASFLRFQIEQLQAQLEMLEGKLAA